MKGVALVPAMNSPSCAAAVHLLKSCQELCVHDPPNHHCDHCTDAIWHWDRSCCRTFWKLCSSWTWMPQMQMLACGSMEKSVDCKASLLITPGSLTPDIISGISPRRSARGTCKARLVISPANTSLLWWVLQCCMCFAARCCVVHCCDINMPRCVLRTRTSVPITTAGNVGIPLCANTDCVVDLYRPQQT